MGADWIGLFVIKHFFYEIYSKKPSTFHAQMYHPFLVGKCSCNTLLKCMHFIEMINDSYAFYKRSYSNTINVSKPLK
jgi:hypothetical protein